MTSTVKIYLIDGTDELFRPRRFARHRPDVYYVTDDYAGYASGRFPRVNPDVLRDLLGMAYKFVTRKATPRSSVPTPR